MSDKMTKINSLSALYMKYLLLLAVLSLPTLAADQKDSAIGMELDMTNSAKWHDWAIAQHAKHTADVRVVMDGKPVEMSFKEFRLRMFGPLVRCPKGYGAMQDSDGNLHSATFTEDSTRGSAQ